MKNRISLSRDLCARFLLVAAGLSLAVVACDDSEDRRDLEDSGGSGGSTAGSGGKSGGSSGSAGKGGSSAGSNNNGGAGGDPLPEGGSAGAPVGGAGGDDAGGAGGDAGGAQGGGAGEGGQGGAGSDALTLFADDYGSGIGFVAFGGSNNDLTVDATTAHSGAASLKIQVPAGNYTGGSLVSATDVDLSEYNAVSFWAKASVSHALNTVGLGNDAIGGGPLTVERYGLALTTGWQHFVVPIPSPSKLNAESGLFHFAEGAEAAGAYTIWLDDIEYVKADNLGAAVPRITAGSRNVTIGSPFPMPQAFVDYTIDAVPFTLTVSAPWFDYDSLDEAVASVTAGVVTPIAVGTTEITGELDTVVATGKITVNVAEVTVPAAAAPTPANLPADVISLFSNAFTNVTVDTWSAGWDNADVADVLVATNATKLYTLLAPNNFAGVEFTSAPVDATLMTHFHVDVWMPAATVFTVKLVDFGADGGFGGGDDTEASVSSPGLTTKAWQPLEIPLASFTALGARAHLAQMILTAEAGATIYLDNLYFHK